MRARATVAVKGRVIAVRRHRHVRGAAVPPSADYACSMDIACEVCIVGGGPAGMMLGLLLARKGVDVVVLEKHGDFLRDFRGDTVHPSTLDVLDELGLQDEVSHLPHRDVSRLQVSFVDGTYPVADFSRLSVAHPFIRFMPQWDFLNVLADAAEALPTFRLLRRHEVTDLLRDRGAVVGVVASTPDGTVRVRAALTVAADGRGSVVRDRAGLAVHRFAAPMDVLWFRVSRAAGDAEGLDMHVGPGRLVLAIDRGHYWQVAYVVRKDTDHALRNGDVDVLRRSMSELVPALRTRMSEIHGWDDVRTLTVQLDRLRRWHGPGVLCIGDAAHAMSPVGGVGINLAIQDAVAAARILTRRLASGPLDSTTLAAIQRRRWLPTVATQLGQRAAHRFLVEPALGTTEAVPAPAALRMLARLPFLQGLIGRMVGVGLRPEHVHGQKKRNRRSRTM